MSVLDVTEAEIEHKKKSIKCLLCVNPFVYSEPIVYWNCVNGELWLHHDCAEKLALNLLYDARRAADIGRGKSLTAGIGVRLHIGSSVVVGTAIKKCGARAAEKA